MPVNLRYAAAVVVALGLVCGTDVVEAQEEATTPTGATCDGVDESVLFWGAVRDLLTGSPMSGAAITLRSERYGPVLLGEGETDLNGVFRFCYVPRVPGITIQANAGGIESRVLEVPDPAVGEIGPLYVEWSVPVNIAGQVIDAATGAPLAGARVTLPGRGARSTSDEAGEFRIQGQGGGQLVLSTSLIGYTTRVDTLDTVSGDALDLIVELSTEAIELDPIEVTVRARTTEEARTVGSRFDAMTVVQIDSVLPRIIDFEGLLRAARFPGVTVRTTPGGGLCIAQTRRATGCAMAEVYLNGVRLNMAGTVLTALDPGSIESLQFLDPLEAWTRFIGPNVQNGVLVIRTRGGRPGGVEWR